MNQIYIVDLIGTHCGMHYYHSSFQNILSKGNYDTIILSNYSDKTPAFFPIIFKKNRFLSMLYLIIASIKFLIHAVTHRKSTYIYLSYGEPWDLPFLTIASAFNKNFIIDIHEVHALRYRDISHITKIYKFIYSKFIKVIIYHSDRTNNILNEINYKQIKLYVPHFKYNFPKEYSITNLGDDITHVFCSKKPKFLFFGNISIIKGAEVLINSLVKLNEEINNIEVVIAGKNVDNIKFSVLKNHHTISIIDRHINDDELVYLYRNTDYILLPYLKSSQSGIFAMATYFEKPMILSKIPYFISMISQFPSFGILTPIEQYEEGIKNIIRNKRNFYSKEDLNKYLEEDIYQSFILELSKIII